MISSSSSACAFEMQEAYILKKKLLQIMLEYEEGLKYRKSSFRNTSGTSLKGLHMGTTCSKNQAWRLKQETTIYLVGRAYTLYLLSPAL